MTSKFLTIPRLAVYLGIPIERAHALVEQEIITSIEVKGTTLADRASADQWRANQPKPTVKNTAPAPADKFMTRWTRAEDKYLREHYLTETLEEIAQALGRPPRGVEHRKCHLASKKRLVGPEYITGPQAAAMLGRTQTYPYSLARTGKLHPVTVPGRAKKFFLKSEVAAIAETRGRAEIERPAAVEKTWSPDKFGDAVGLSGGRVRRLCKEGKIPARFVSEEKPAGSRAGHWVIPDSSRTAYLAKKRRAAVPPSDSPVPVAARLARSNNAGGAAPATTAPPGPLTISEVAVALGLSYYQVSELLRAGTIVGKKVDFGKGPARWEVEPSEIDRYRSGRRPAERKARAAVQAELKAEVAEVAEPEPKPEATVETAPAARGGLRERVAAACAIFKRRRA